MRSAPPSTTARTSSPSRVKSAESTEGTIRIGGAIAPPIASGRALPHRPAALYWYGWAASGASGFVAQPFTDILRPRLSPKDHKKACPGQSFYQGDGTTLLAGDIGGTKTDLAVYSTD